MKRVEQNKFNLGISDDLKLMGNGVVTSLIWGFVRATSSKLRRIKREHDERVKRREPVYNVNFFNLIQTRIKQVTQTTCRGWLFRPAVSSVRKRGESIKRVFKQRKRLAALNKVDRHVNRLKSFWLLNRELVSLCRSLVQHIKGVQKDILYSNVPRFSNRQMNSDVGLVARQRNLNRLFLLNNGSRITIYGYKWILGSEAFFHGRVARLLYTLRERKGILIKHFQVAHGIWRKLPNWMGVLGRRRQLYGLSRILRVNPFDQRDGFRLLISSVYNNFKVLIKLTQMLRDDKRGVVVRSLRLLKQSRLRSPLQLSLRKLRTVKSRVLPINIVLISKRSNFSIIFGEQRGKMLIAISSGCIGFAKKKYRRRKSAGIKLASLSQKVLRFLKRRYKRLKVKMIIHESLRRNKTARTVFWNIQRDLVDRSFKRFRQFRRMYYGKWFRNILIEAGCRLGKFNCEQQAVFITDYISKLGKRSHYRTNWMRKVMRSKTIGSSCLLFNSDLSVLDNIQMANSLEKRIGTRLKWALQDNLAGNWRKQIIKIAKSWYVRTYVKPKFSFIKKFIWRSAAAELEYQRQRNLRFKKKYGRVVRNNRSLKKIKRNKYRKNVSGKK